jgi:hypothetical protein
MRPRRIHKIKDILMAVKRMCIKCGLLLICFLLSLVFISCDTKESIHPYIVLNVNISQTVDATHKLLVVFYLSPAAPWANPLPAVLSYSEKTIIIPPLNTGQYPLFFVIVYDRDNNVKVTAGDWYQGWYRKVDRTTDILLPIIMPSVEVMLLNVDLDTHGVW